MEDSNRNFKLQTCEDFIEVLASKAAVPGGGGAAALTGAIGIALGNMVGSLTVGKKTYADVEDEIIECKKEADEIAKEFLELMDKDAEAFEPLSKAYGLPKSTPEEIAEVIAPQFAETDLDTVTAIVKRYYDQDTWKSNLIFEKESFELLEDILEDSGELSERVSYENLITTKYAQEAAEK